MKEIKLNNGVLIPMLGLGVFQSSREQTISAVEWFCYPVIGRWYFDDQGNEDRRLEGY